tara:strand:- start:116 stop:346 length:231 start_codon:yes stop_codon:yes gene_type:complete
MKREQVEALKKQSGEVARNFGGVIYTVDGRGLLYANGQQIPIGELLRRIETARDAARDLDNMIQQIETKKPAGAKA